MRPSRYAVLLLLLLPAAARADARSEAADNLAKGKAALDDKDPDLAIAYFTQALRLDPGSSEARFQRGNASYDKDDYDRAIADYGDGLRLIRDAKGYTHRGLEALAVRGGGGIRIRPPRGGTAADRAADADRGHLEFALRPGRACRMRTTDYQCPESITAPVRGDQRGDAP